MIRTAAGLARWLLMLLPLLLWVSPAYAADDRDLYQAVVERVHNGDGYYHAAAVEMRQRGFPLRPALTFREPTLSWLLALLPGTLARLAALWALTASAVMAWAYSLRDTPFPQRLGLIILLMAGLANAGQLRSVYLHEAWAINFMILSLALRRNIVLGVAFAMLALLIRETALPFIAAMALVALRLGERRAAMAYAGAIAIAAILWLIHAQMAASVTLPGDPASPGWLAFQGVPLVLSAARWNLLIAPLPQQVGNVVAAICLASLMLVRRPELVIAALTTASLTLGLLFVGRADNDYWGIMFAPFLALGLPELIKTLWPRVLRRAEQERT